MDLVRITRDPDIHLGFCANVIIFLQFKALYKLSIEEKDYYSLLSIPLES